MLFVLTLAACDNEIEAPQELTLQARSAAEVLPADATYYGRINLQAVLENQTFAPFGEEFDFSNADARFADFFEATGFDPREDLQEIYVAYTEANGVNGTPSIVAYATYDRDRLQTFIEERFSAEVERSTHQGATLYRASEGEAEGDDSIVFALAADNMIVASPDETAVEAMLDRLAGQGRALSADAEAMELVGRVAGGTDVWVVLRTLPGDEPNAAPDDALGQQAMQLYGAVDQMAMGFDVQTDGGEATVFLRAADGIAADDVADLARGFVAAAKAQPDMDDAMLETLDGVDVRSQGDLVRVRVRLDNAMLQAHDH